MRYNCHENSDVNVIIGRIKFEKMPENTCHLFGLLNITVLPVVNQFCSKKLSNHGIFHLSVSNRWTNYSPFFFYLYIPFVKLIWTEYKLRGKSLGYWQKINSAGRDEYGV